MKTADRHTHQSCLSWNSHLNLWRIFPATGRWLAGSTPQTKLHIFDGAHWAKKIPYETYDVNFQDSLDPWMVGENGVMIPSPSGVFYEKNISVNYIVSWNPIEFSISMYNSLVKVTLIPNKKNNFLYNCDFLSLHQRIYIVTVE